MRILKKNRGWDFDLLNAELSRLNARKGNVQEALKLSDLVIEPSIRFKLQGDAYIATNQRPKLDEVFQEIDRIVQEANSEDWAFYVAQNGMERPYSKRQLKSRYYLQARLALETEDYEQVIAYVEQAKTLYAGINLVPADLVEISRMTYNRKEYGDIYAKSFYMQGKIYEELGNERKALENYEKFLDLWKNADPGIPEIDDARLRIDALQ